MRAIKKIHDAYFSPIADLVTYSPLPSRTIERIDPFLFLNHHGHQQYPPHNDGLPFGPHPHRGMETVTFILQGDIMHKDSGGHESVIRAGGVQWMTAGKGLIHAEVSSDDFKEKGGDLEILQLWVNLPAKYKMTEPRYMGLQKDQIPEVLVDDSKVKVQILAGKWEQQKGAFETLSGIYLNTIYFEPEGKLSINIPSEHNIFFYVVKGKLNVNNNPVEARKLVEFHNDSSQLYIQAQDASILILGHAKPFNEPVVAQGPFVMNTVQEIKEAYEDYRNGKFGSWNS